MKYNQTASENDLLQLPDIDGLVRDIKKQETVKNASAENVETDFWSLFLKCSKQYEYRRKKPHRRACLIDEEIIDTLKDCDIEKMSVANIVNSVLRAFITQHQEILRQHTTRRNSLI